MAKPNLHGSNSNLLIFGRTLRCLLCCAAAWHGIAFSQEAAFSQAQSEAEAREAERASLAAAVESLEAERDRLG